MSKIFQSLSKCDIQYISSLYYQNVRWATKPRWLPTAKTKVFRVPVRRVYPPEEAAERKRLMDIYRTQMKSFKAFFEEVHRANETSEEVIERLKQEEEEHWLKCMELNDKWNQQIAVEREKRDAEELENEFEKAREEIKFMEQQEKERLEKLEEVIRQEKEASKYFITENNIDEAIDKVLNSPPHNFYYAIDLKGRIYSGLNPAPDLVEDSSVNEKEDQKVSENVS